MKSATIAAIVFVFVMGILATSGLARKPGSDGPRRFPTATAGPAYCIAEHNVGRMEVAVTNVGSFGSKLSFLGERSCFTGEQVWSLSFPKGSRSQYLAGAALWIGAVVGHDTLVSTGTEWWPTNACEFHPAESPFGEMIFRSTVDPSRPEFEGAMSEQDYVGTYYDTCRNCQSVNPDPVLGRPHKPLNVEVTQRSFAWSYSYAQDFVLIDLSIKNIGQERLRKIYLGIYFDVDIYDPTVMGGGQLDDVAGFRRTQPALYLHEPCPPDSDVVNMAWSADNDGDLSDPYPIPNTTATRIVRTPSDSLEVSFNWWLTHYSEPALDFGPQARNSFRSFVGGALGSPIGDRNKYHMLRNGEIDYDQVRTATIGQNDETWLGPSVEDAGSWAMGIGDLQYLLSFGPFQIDPGQSLPITLALVGGINFHSNPNNIMNLPNNPDSWYEGVNFDSLGVAATWADWIYDNPGVDTDSDGYAGEFTVCNLGTDSTEVCWTVIDSTADPITTYDTCRWDYDEADTVWRTGDDIPDFQGASPPPSPSTYTLIDAHGNSHRGLRVEPSTGSVRLIWNGVRCENTVDVFTRELDFEGYRVWLGRDSRVTSYSVVASFDVEDYNRWEYSAPHENFILRESPFSLRDLQCMYGDSCGDASWHPEDYTRSRPLRVPGEAGREDQAFYFEPQDFNRSILGNDLLHGTSEIRKVYPDAPRPPVLKPDSIRILFPNGDDSLFLTPEGFIKFYEYEYTFETLLATVPYWINVTAFDYGSPQTGIGALETSPTINSLVAYALPWVEEVAERGLEVFVYPNPYRLDSDYRERGFEDFGANQVDDDRARSIHFANIPERCTIRIYSIDGDLVRELKHPASFEMEGRCPITPNHACWDLITRNTQQVVSGLYYWTVEDDQGHVQIGKLAIIL